jgi:hypothetical protein
VVPPPRAVPARGRATGAITEVPDSRSRARWRRARASLHRRGPGPLLDDAEVAALLDSELAREFAPGDLDHLNAVYQQVGFP